MAAPSITVFGGSGFLGRHLVKRLAEGGARLRVAVRYPEAAGFLKPMGEVGQVVPLQANLRDEASVTRAVEGADAVVNLVGILYQRGRQRFRAVHVEGAARVARAAAAAGARRFVQVSAIGADADSPAEYGRTKAAGEAAVSEAFDGATSVRPSIIFGPEDDFFNRFAAMARLSPALPLIGFGHTRFQPVYVGDVAEAMARLLDDPASAGKTYELGGPRVYSFREIMALVLRETGRNRLLVPLPYPLAMLQARFLELLPVPPLTRDQVQLLKRDNVVGGDAPGLADLGVTPTAVDAILPSYLGRYRRRGSLDPSRAP
ncbi:MAG: complex I NDUFA9 subunit family protein [Alphaproteobacteria bacterium]|nr:complex I NDUFA9 subunit family protein [Alphaproteobacteria bacterium]